MLCHHCCGSNVPSLKPEAEKLMTERLNRFMGLQNWKTASKLAKALLAEELTPTPVANEWQGKTEA